MNLLLKKKEQNIKNIILKWTEKVRIIKLILYKMCALIKAIVFLKGISVLLISIFKRKEILRWSLCMVAKLNLGGKSTNIQVSSQLYITVSPIKL